MATKVIKQLFRILLEILRGGTNKLMTKEKNYNNVPCLILSETTNIILKYEIAKDSTKRKRSIN